MCMRYERMGGEFDFFLRLFHCGLTFLVGRRRQDHAGMCRAYVTKPDVTRVFDFLSVPFSSLTPRPPPW